MTATDELRRMLDERGVEWWETTEYIGATITSGGIESHYLVTTWWKSPTFGEVHAVDYEDGTLSMSCLNNCDFTPEQAIEATLGRGTCHMEKDFRRWDDDLGWLTSYTCSVCGESVILMSDRKPSCCPNCGRRVKEVYE